jgi:NCS1 family nucleobase:cation symporter-1
VDSSANTDGILQIIIIDYYLVKRGNIHTPSMFDQKPGSLYYYTRGWNLKALACWVSAVVVGIPGLAGAYHPSWVSAAAVHVYQTGWVICFAVAALLYFAACTVFPPKVFPSSAGLPKKFEILAESDGYLDGEHRVEFRVDSSEGEEDQSKAVSITELVGDEKV